MSEKLGSVLIAEVGSVTTRATLVDAVDGETRLIGQADAPTTSEPPYRDVLVGILEAAARISQLTGRVLVDEDGKLIKPQNNERDGINHLLVTTSAAGNLDMIIAAIASDVSAHSARRAARCTYTNVQQTVALDDAALDTEVQRKTSWVERQVQTMLKLRPDVVLLAGGLEGGARETVCRLARIVGFVVQHINEERAQRQRGSSHMCPVIYAGNSEAQQCVRDGLAGRAEVLVVENLRPLLEQERLEATRRELLRLYNQRVLPRLPGMGSLQHLSSASVSTVCAAEGLITRFLAERYQQYQRRVLTLDVGSTSTSVILASASQYTPAVLGSTGIGYSVMRVVQQRGLNKIARWLPFPISDQDLLHWLLNKQLRPQVIPSSREDILIEQAVAREALTLGMDALIDECGEARYDLVVAGGGVLARSSYPGLAALTILDALQPTAEDGTLALDLHLDVLGLLPACGALAHLEADAAVTIFERDVLRNVPLATCVVALGEGKPGDVAVEAELTTNRGTRHQVTVRHGQIARLPLSQGVRGQLTLRPASKVRIGQNEPGAEVSSDVAAIGGSALGVVIDARGRPLRLATDSRERCIQLWEWLVALGAEHNARHPYLNVDVNVLTPTSERIAGARIGADLNGRAAMPPAAPRPAPMQPPAPAPAPASPDDDDDMMDLPDMDSLTSVSSPGVSEPAPALPPSLPEEEPQKRRFGRARRDKEQPSPEAAMADLNALREPQQEPKKRRGLFGKKSAEPEVTGAPTIPQEPLAEEPKKRRGLFGKKSAEPETPAQEPAAPQQGQRVSLEDLAAQELSQSQEPAAPQQGQRVSLEDLAAQGSSQPQEPAAPQQGRRVSLEDLAAQGSSQSQQGGDKIQDDLASLRDTVDKPEKRGLFGRGRKK